MAKLEYTIHHWDTFDNETIQVGEAATFEEAEEKVRSKYGSRISGNGADRVDIVYRGAILKQYRVS